MDIKLSQTVSCGGCAGKLNPIDLYSVLSKLPNTNPENLMVNFDTGDDACVYFQSDDTALIFTTDFIAPLIDNPFDFGRIAATNALSDIYAMGGKPILALNVVCFNQELGNEVLENILLGGASVCNLSKTILCGGHTVRSIEVRYGLSVLGSVNPKNLITNSSGISGDTIFLTKPLGTGILSQALKSNLLPNEIENTLVNHMCELNDKVAKVMQQVGVKCATDITGFGLLGHLLKLTQSSSCSAEIYLNELPYLPRTLEFARQNIHSGNLLKNKKYVEKFIEGDHENHPNSKLLFDPQTSGGMLICVNKDKVQLFKKSMDRHKLFYAKIGKLTSDEKHSIKVKLQT